jgi:hypothetical protein
MHKPLKIALVAAIAATTCAAPAFAQYPPSDQYQRDSARYQDQQSDYRDAQDEYAARRADYDAARRDYDRRMAAYSRARDNYDRRYGPGAYARAYGPGPAWDSGYWDYSAAPPPPGPGIGGPGGPGGPGPSAAYDAPCRPKNNNSAVAGGLIGALAGAALGSNVAARNARPEGAVLGAVVGGVIGAKVGDANDNYKAAKCDETGYYFDYSDTQPYQESDYDRRSRSGRYDYSYYTRQRCRLAIAPAQWGGREDYRYVRVCPDDRGRYRITG